MAEEGEEALTPLTHRTEEEAGMVHPLHLLEEEEMEDLEGEAAEGRPTHVEEAAEGRPIRTEEAAEGRPIHQTGSTLWLRP